MKTQIGLTPDQRMRAGRILNAVLATEYALYTATRGAHWNVIGSSFFELHKFFEQQYEALDDIVDNVAERARSLDVAAASAMHDYVELAYGRIELGSNWSAAQLLHGLLGGHEMLIRHLRANLGELSEIGDDGTLDFLTGLMEQHEKMAWMLRAASPT